MATNTPNITEFVETVTSARFMLNRATTLNDVKYFTTMVTKMFRRPSVAAMFGSELAPILQVQENLTTVKKAELTAEDFKDWFGKQVKATTEALQALEDSLKATDVNAWDAAFKSSVSGNRSSTPALAYVTLGDTQVLLTEAINRFIDDQDWHEAIASQTPISTLVARWALDNALTEEHAIAILRGVGMAFRKMESGIRYRAERSDAGEPKAAEAPKAKK